MAAVIVPADIATSPRIVAWVYTRRNGKRTKEPVQPRNPERHAMVDTPSTWGTWDQAMAVYARGLVDGPGIVLGEGLVGVDLDHCRDPQTGVLTPDAWATIQALDSYTEVSPSGTGVHILLRGTLPAGRRRIGPVEMYDAGRFFTVTGRRVPGTRSEVAERTEELALVHRALLGPRQRLEPGRVPRQPMVGDDATLLRRAHAASNGQKFGALWRGDTTGYPSQSEADMALANLLAWWCRNDAARVDALFRQSGLMRPKWDQRRTGDGTYGARTVAAACARGRR